MEYTQLDFSRYETRFLKLVGLINEPDQLLRFDIVTASLSSPPDYNALSYCWGDTSQKVEIEISGKSVEVSTNLEKALHHCSLGIGDLIWVDAICIYQTDLFEKSYQVNLMGQIYSKAKMVIAWLGAEERGSHLAAALLENLSNARRRLEMWRDGIRATKDKRSYLEVIWNDPHAARSLRGLGEIFRRPYWERVWIIQEISKAQKVDVRCGKLRMDLEVMLYAGSLHTDMSERTRALLAAVSEFRAQEQSEAGRMSRMSLMQALLTSRHSCATDQRDKVYALLGLARDSLHLIPMPSYAESCQQVYEQLSASIISSGQRSNAILLASKAPLSYRHPDVSSWAIDWANMAYTVPSWLARNEITIPPAPSFTSALKAGDSSFSTRGRCLGYISSREVDLGVSARYPSYVCPKQAHLKLNNLLSSFLERLSPGYAAARQMYRPDMVSALSRMIRDADKEDDVSASYNLDRVSQILSRLGDLGMSGLPVSTWARKVNKCTAKKRYPQQHKFVPQANAPSSAVSTINEPERPSSKRPFHESSLISSSHVPTATGKRWRGYESESEDELDHGCKEERIKFYEQESHSSGMTVGDLAAFKIWEEILAELDSFTTPHLQFATVNDGSALIIVPSQIQTSDLIYDIDSCSLPVILRPDQRGGEFVIVGEACLGRDLDGRWIRAAESSLPKANDSDRRPFTIVYDRGIENLRLNWSLNGDPSQ